MISRLLRVFGYRLTLILGDALVLSRWRWVAQRLPATANGEELIDIGCGNGSFTFAAAARGYRALGLTWNQVDMDKATQRTADLRASSAAFEICDVRTLDERVQYNGRFDIALCLENIEHILNDFKLMRDMAAVLKPGGRLLLTTPNLYFRAITSSENGPFEKVETGEHVRRGYSPAMLVELATSAGLTCEEISYCGGLGSQKLTWLMRRLKATLGVEVGSLLTLPLRPVASAVDGLIGGTRIWPAYSICMIAVKPRLES